MEGPPVVSKTEFDVKNEGQEGEKGVVSLGKIAEDLGFENRCAVSDEEASEIRKGNLGRVLHGRYNRLFLPFTIKFKFSR